MSEAVARSVTLEEFLAYEGEMDVRYELYDGRIVAMAPAILAHGEVAIEAAVALRRRVPRPCAVLMQPGVIRPDRNDSFFVPDLAVQCVPRLNGERWAREPLLIVEVLSPSTVSNDRGIKVDAYRAIPSVRAILLLESEARRATLWERDSDRWIVRDFIGSAVLPLALFDTDLPLDEVYGVAGSAEDS